MSIVQTQANQPKMNKGFWVVWAIELWERFGYYGASAILALYFVKVLGYTEAQSFYVFGSFTAFVYGFIWIGGWLGDNYLGSKRTMILGAIILMLSYAALALSNAHTIFYALSGIIIGNALFKANPSALISKMYANNEPALDSAMTLYYMAVNLGSMVSMFLTPIIAEKYGWTKAFWLCSGGLALGLANYFVYYRLLADLNNPADRMKMPWQRVGLVLTLGVACIIGFAQLLVHTKICNAIVYTVTTGAFLYFIKIALGETGKVRTKMLIAMVLMIQAVIFFVLYNQMPTSLTFFAVHNINNHFLGWNIPPAEYQVLNALVIVIMSPILAKFYKQTTMSYITKFCIGMSLCSAAFLVLVIPQFTATDGLASPWWMVLTYYLQSVGELLISGLGLAMVAVLCPPRMSGFMMGIWWLATMLAGPVSAWVGVKTTPPNAEQLSTVASLHLYCHVFFQIGLVTGLVALCMWAARPWLNKQLA
jgi:POT family proton-dependent oligopeptide transporter